MQAIPLGRVTVATAGTPVTLTSLVNALVTAGTLNAAALPPSNCVAKIEVWPDPTATGKVYVKSQPPGFPAPVIVAALPVPTGGYPLPWETDGDHVRNIHPYQQFSLDAATNGDGAYITLWVA